MGKPTLRELFINYLTEDSDTKDARKKSYNLAIFITPKDRLFPGAPVFSRTELYMVMEKFDKAVKEYETNNKPK